MKTSLRISVITFVLTAVTLAYGWFFHTQKQVSVYNYSKQFGDGNVCVESRTLSCSATTAAENLKSEYLANGYTELPVSTETFKIFINGDNNVVMFLSEDISNGNSLTTLYHSKNNFN